VGSHTPHWMFVVDLERAAASSWYGQKHGCIFRCTGRNEERGQSLLGGERAGSSWWPWRDANALVVSWLEHVASWCRSVGRFPLVHCTGSTDSGAPDARLLYSAERDPIQLGAARKLFYTTFVRKVRKLGL
jgi:hypothetical protein